MNTRSKKNQGKTRRKHSPGGCDDKSPSITCEQTSKAIPSCPICGGLIPSNENPGAWPGAISRVDNSTEICSRCGSLEALIGADGFLSPESLEALKAARVIQRKIEAGERGLIGKEVKK